MAYLIARNQESKFNNLKLALLFNRIDIVQTDIFSGDQDFKLDQKIELLELALVQNNPEFIEKHISFFLIVVFSIIKWFGFILNKIVYPITRRILTTFSGITLRKMFFGWFFHLGDFIFAET